jgi:hypothetical protein
MYYKSIAPEIRQLHPGKYGEAVRDRSFLIRVGAVKALRPSKGQESARLSFSHRDLSRRTGCPYISFLTD